MPNSLLFTNKDDKNNLDRSTNSLIPPIELIDDEEINTSSLLTILKRLCISWRELFFNTIRLLLTLLFMSMLNLTARFACFTRQRTSPLSPSASSITPTMTSSSFRTLENDCTDSSQSRLIIEKLHQQPIDLPSLPNSKMAHILVQQQTHRTPSISIHQSSSTERDSDLPMTHSVDERLFLKDSTGLLHFLTRFASEPQISKYQTHSTHTNGHRSKSPVVFALSSPVSNSYLPVNESEKDELHFDEIFYFNCDKIQPVSTSLTEDFNSDKTDTMITIPSQSLTEENSSISTINGEVKTEHLDDEILLDTSPALNTNEPSCERHFRRRKRRSSLTKTSISLDDTQSTINSFEKIDINQQSSSEVNDKLELKPNDSQEEINTIESQTSDKEESNEITVDTNHDDDTPASVSRYRGRRLRYRLYRHATSISSSPEVPSTGSPQFYLPNEAFNVEAPRTHSPPPLSPVTLSPLPSPVSPTLTITSNQRSPSTLIGTLQRVNSVGTTKKNVRFADSIGLELAQVQYIRSSISDESKELSFLLGSSLLSSSPPSFSKNNLYVPKKSHLEHKPWSFDVDLTADRQLNQTALPRRFFCLYRQPNSEHPDIYLHEIWKSQIKLEYADIPLKCSSTGEQQLSGTLWVTNASFWKYVTVKYTFNRWMNTCECEAQHRCHSNDFRNIDQFEFLISIPADVDRIDFVLRYCVNGQEHWDNNDGKNYTLQTESAYTPSTTISLPHDCDFNEMRFY